MASGGDDEISITQGVEPLSQRTRRNPNRGKQTSKSTSAIDDEDSSQSIISSQKGTRPKIDKLDSSKSKSSHASKLSNGSVKSKPSHTKPSGRSSKHDKRMMTKSHTQRLKEKFDCGTSTSSQGSSVDDRGNEDRPCVKCSGMIDDFTKALCCEFCAAWACLECTGIPESMYDVMMDEEVPNVIWTCDSCVHALPTIKKLGKTLQGVLDEQDSCKQEINKLSTKVDRLESSIESKVQEAIEDYREREARKCNVIIHNIPESNKNDSKERRHEDIQVINEMLEEGLNVDDATLQSVVRLGKRVEGKSRLLKVEVDSVKSKRNLLQNAKKLRRTETWKKVFITPDHTPKERQINKDLREEIKRRTEEGEEGLVIRRGKITKILPREGEEEQAARPVLPQSFR